MLIPTIKQWRSWGIPSRLTALGVLLAVTSIVFSVLIFAVPYIASLGEGQPLLGLTLHLRAGGFEVSVHNAGDGTARQVYVDLLSWRLGAPGLDVQETYTVRDLGPRADYTFSVDLQNEYSQSNDRPPMSGYIVAGCANAEKSRAWAFHLPNLNSKAQQKFWDDLHVGSEWPIIEFEYPADKPYLQCVNYPKGVCEITRWSRRDWVPSGGGG